jgi:hypothetical protein
MPTDEIVNGLAARVAKIINELMQMPNALGRVTRENERFINKSNVLAGVASYVLDQLTTDRELIVGGSACTQNEDGMWCRHDARSQQTWLRP